MYTQVKSVSLTHNQVENVNELSISKGSNFSKTIQFIIDDFFLRYVNSEKNEGNNKELSSQISINRDMIFSIIEEMEMLKNKLDSEMELLKKMVLLSGMHISRSAEKNLLKEFPNILE